VRDGVIDGGMLPKIEGAVRALKGGTAQALIIDGRIPHALRLDAPGAAPRGHRDRPLARREDSRASTSSPTGTTVRNSSAAARRPVAMSRAC